MFHGIQQSESVSLPCKDCKDISFLIWIENCFQQCSLLFHLFKLKYVLQVLSFVADAVKIKGVSGSVDSLHFDFIGSFIDYDSLLTSSGNHFVQEESDGFPVLKQIGNLYYTGNVVWV